jgi:phosphatidylglycerophosphatase A
MGAWKDKVCELACTSFMLGYSPVAPGTVGSLPGVGVFVLIAILSPRDYHAPLIAAALFASCVLSVLLGPWAERHWNKRDPRYFVLDEYAGLFLTFLIFRVESVIATAVWGFVVTRIADIIKPAPARRLEELPGGWGMLLDDLAASLWAGIILVWLVPLFPSLFAF